MYTNQTEYIDQLESYCQATYGLSAGWVIGDTTHIESAYERGETHTELADYYGEKYGLTKRTDWTMERATAILKGFKG